MLQREISTPEIAEAYNYARGTVGQLIRRDGFPPPLRRSRPYHFDADEVKRWMAQYRMICEASRAAGREKQLRARRRDKD